MTKPILGITMGDPAGVGPEICLQAVSNPAVQDACTPLVLGDAQVLARVADHCQLPMIEQVIPHDRPELWRQASRPTIVDFAAIDADSVRPGVVSAETGRASVAYIEGAVAAALAKDIAAITTGPINKAAINAAGFLYPGHTELLADKTNTRQVTMMLTCEELTCCFVTTHVGYRDVPDLLTIARIVDTIQLGASAMQQLRNREIKIVVCGLNPHAGEEGLFGRREEEEIIGPAIEKARSSGWNIEGPLPPDTAFLRQRRADTDLFVCMYHDQGHIPLKALAFDVAVNVTLGLPVIRTSVDHGTACDIAWTNQADTTSMVQAILHAVRLAG